MWETKISIDYETDKARQEQEQEGARIRHIDRINGGEAVFFSFLLLFEVFPPGVSISLLAMSQQWFDSEMQESTIFVDHEDEDLDFTLDEMENDTMEAHLVDGLDFNSSGEDDVLPYSDSDISERVEDVTDQDTDKESDTHDTRWYEISE